MKPIIGINVNIREIEKATTLEAAIEIGYFTAVQQAGGIAVLVPPMTDSDLDELLPRLNGIMLIGGRDYDPGHYHEQACANVKPLVPMRDDFDCRLIQKIVAGSNIPVLGICAGAQLLNIGLGGTLIQDIPGERPDSRVEHSTVNGFERGWNRHAVRLEPKSKLSSIYPELNFSVPTSHHQAIKRLGAGLVATAHADDGIIEAVEYAGKPFAIGVQWHPERDYEGNKQLFSAFVKAASAVPVSSK